MRVEPGAGRRCQIPWKFIVLMIILSTAGRVIAGESGNVDAVRVPNSGIHPQAQTDARGRVHLIYFSGDPAHGDIFYVRSDNGIKPFTKPVQVNSQSGSVIITGTIRGPQLAIGKDDRVHVAWMGSDKAEPKAMRKMAPMLYTRMKESEDGFEPQRNLIQRHPGLDGGGSVAADREGNVYVAWHAPKSENNEADRWVWIARSTDDGKTFAPEIAANTKPTGACGCCGMKISAASGGDVYIEYRSATKMVNRDVYLLVSKDHGKTFTTITVDPWKIAACAMSTSAFASSTEQTIAAWETNGHVRYGIIPARKKMKDPYSVPGQADNQKHPSLAINSKGEFIVAWAEGTGWNKGGSVVWQVFNKEGEPLDGQSGRTSGLPVWSVPAAFIRSDDTFGIIF